MAARPNNVWGGAAQDKLKSTVVDSGERLGVVRSRLRVSVREIHTRRWIGLQTYEGKITITNLLIEFFVKY